MDVAPYPLRWAERERFHYFAGYVLGRAFDMDIPLIWGGDWDGDFEIFDNKFDDLVHFQLANPV